MKLANCDKLLLGCLYRSPNNADNDKEQINMELKASVQYGYCHVLIVGDFQLSRAEIIWSACATPGLAQVFLEEGKRQLVTHSSQLDNTAGWPDGFWYGRRHL